MKQAVNTLLMIRPSHFGFNAETAASNSFQNNIFHKQPGQLALDEFNAVVTKLRNEDISIITFNDQSGNSTPDAVFPNNWVSFHEDGKVILYPMQTLNRRREKRPEIIDKLHDEHGFEISEIIDLSYFEKQSEYLEGTGSIVFDHVNKIAYMAISSRSHPKPLDKITEVLGFNQQVFHTADFEGNPVYHTNVVMSLGNEFAIVCTSAIPSEKERQTLLTELEKNNRALIEIDGQQMSAFAGNVLEVSNSKNDPFLLLSDTALKSLSNNQIKKLEKYGTLLPVSIPTIELVGGGGIRCMVAEVFLPKKTGQPEFKITTPKSNLDFEKYFGLRWSVLRKPWNQPLGSEKDEREETSFHRMAIASDGTVAGVTRLQFNNESEAQIRYMAVAPEFQGKGVGKKLMLAMENETRKAGRTRIFLQARENAVPFYISLGYHIIEKTFLMYGEIQHFSMEKALNS